MKQTTLQWLNLAETDLRSCENNLQDEFVTNIIAFHAQQAVEKSFKALIEEKGIEVPRIHNLIRLHSIVEKFIINPISQRILDALDNVYTNSRYPSDIGMSSMGKPTLTEARELYENAKMIYNSIQKTIEEKPNT